MVVLVVFLVFFRIFFFEKILGMNWFIVLVSWICLGVLFVLVVIILGILFVLWRFELGFVLLKSLFVIWVKLIFVFFNVKGIVIVEVFLVLGVCCKLFILMNN